MSGVRPIADPFALERALREAEGKLAALQAAALEVCAAWGADQPGADGRSPWGSLIELKKVLEGQGGVPTAVVHFDDTGEAAFSATPGVRLLTICDATPDDRVYQISTVVEHAALAKLIGSSRIGSIGDMPGKEAAVAAHFRGEAPPKGPALAVVTGDGE